MLFYIALFSLLVMAAIAMPSINVIASVRGKKFEIEAETVEEFTSKVENAANLEAGQQSVLFRGKVLSPSDILAEVGVSANDVLMVVKGRRHRSKPDAESSDVALAGGLDADAYQKAIDGGANPEEMKKAMQAMDSLLDSDFVDEYFSDDAKLEAARLQLLENIDKYDQMMPGFKEQAREVASDPQKWREAMNQAKDQMLKLKQQRDAMRAKGQPFNPAPENSVDDVVDEEEE